MEIFNENRQPLKVDKWGSDVATFVPFGEGSGLPRLGARARARRGMYTPSVYYLRQGTSANEILDQVTDTFEAHWNPNWDHRSAFLGFTRDEVVTLASIRKEEGEIGARN